MGMGLWAWNPAGIKGEEPKTEFSPVDNMKARTPPAHIRGFA